VDKTIFAEFPTVQFAGTKSNEDFTYRWYEAERIVLGKPLREHMRFAVAYWHSLAMNGSDPFGAPTIQRPWMNRTDVLQAARDKADAAFDLFRVLDLPFFTRRLLPPRVLEERLRDCGLPAKKDVEFENSSLMGNGKSFHPSKIHVRCGHQSRSGCLCL